MDENDQKNASGIGGLEQLLSNPALLTTLNSLLGSTQKEPPSTPNGTSQSLAADGLSKVLADPAMMAKLPAIMEMLKPMVEVGTNPPKSIATAANQTDGGEPITPSDQSDQALPAAMLQAGKIATHRDTCRDDLLLALKPFLSPQRAAAVDVILRLSRLGNVLGTLQK